MINWQKENHFRHLRMNEHEDGVNGFQNEPQRILCINYFFQLSFPAQSLLRDSGCALHFKVHKLKGSTMVTSRWQWQSESIAVRRVTERDTGQLVLLCGVSPWPSADMYVFTWNKLRSHYGCFHKDVKIHLLHAAVYSSSDLPWILGIFRLLKVHLSSYRDMLLENKKKIKNVSSNSSILKSQHSADQS